MLLLLTAVFLLKQYGTDAVPIPAATPTSSEFETPVFSRGDSSGGRNSRTVLDILWSCLATTFACTWVSAHPNVPWRNEGKWTLLGRRIFLMFFSVLAPEFMIMWAFKQWRGAVMIKEFVNKSISGSDKQWTTTHGHFLQMGGFQLHTTTRENLSRKESAIFRMRERDLIPDLFLRHSVDDGQLMSKIHDQFEEATGSRWPPEISEAQINFGDDIWQGVLTFESFKQLLAEKLITFPTITEDEINDKSKGDALSKAIALFQLTWFIIQIIARATQGLAISELELTTAALAGLNSVMYFFWWSKPCDVRCPVVIRTKGVEELLAKRSDDVTWKSPDLQPDFNFRTHIWSSLITRILRIPSSLSLLFASTPRRADGEKRKRYRRHNVGPDNLNEGLQLIRRAAYDDAQDVSVVTSDEDGARMRASAAFFYETVCLPFDHIQQNARTVFNGTKWMIKLAALPIYSLLYVVDMVLFIPIEMILHFNPKNGSLSDMIESSFDTEAMQEAFAIIFYSVDAGVKPLLNTSSIAGVLFGAVHCLAWRFSFPSHVEQVMWRVASVGIVGACVVSFAGTHTWEHIDDALDSHVLGKVSLVFLRLIWIVLLFSSALVYVIARLTVLVLAVASLRSLPSSAFDTPSWVELIPHI